MVRHTSIKLLYSIFLNSLFFQLLAGPIHEAARRGDLDALKEMVTHSKNDIHKKDKSGRAPLFYASSGGHLLCVDYLITKGAQSDILDKEGWSPIHLAAAEGYKDIVAYFLVKGVSVDLQTRKIDENKYHFTPLMLASLKGNLDVVVYLLSHGASVCFRDADGNTALHHAICGVKKLKVIYTKHFYKEIALALIDNGALLGVCNNEGYTPLKLLRSMIPGGKASFSDGESLIHRARAYALANGYTEESLSNIGTRIHNNIENNKLDDIRTEIRLGKFYINLSLDNDHTPLTFAIFSNKNEIAKFLISQGADMNAKDPEGRTPLILAAEKGNDEMVSFLLKYGVNPNSSTGMLYGETALHKAVENNHPNVVKLLIQHGASIKIGKYPMGYSSPLDCALIQEDKTNAKLLALRLIEQGDYEGLQKYVELQGNLSVASSSGKPLIHAAIKKGNSSIVAGLLNKGVPINLRDGDGATPLHIATKYKQSEIIRSLLVLGASPRIRDSYGRLPLYWSRKNNTPMIERLLFGRDPHKILFQDIIGMKRTIKEMREVVDSLKPGKDLCNFLLLQGIPGCGKTYLAKAIANEAQCSFVSRDSSSFISRAGGAGAEKVKMAFAEARMKAPAILFIDEIDSIAAQRKQDLGGGFMANKRDTVNALLTEIDGFSDNSSNPVILIGATNFLNLLDEAFISRAKRIIQVKPLSDKNRKRVLEHYIRDLPWHNINPNTIGNLMQATVGISTPRDLRNIVESAQRFANIRRGSNISKVSEIDIMKSVSAIRGIPVSDSSSDDSDDDTV